MWEKPKNLNLIEGNKYSVMTKEKFVHQVEHIEGKFINIIQKTEVKQVEWIWQYSKIIQTKSKRTVALVKTN